VFHSPRVKLSWGTLNTDNSKGVEAGPEEKLPVGELPDHTLVVGGRAFSKKRTRRGRKVREKSYVTNHNQGR